MKPRDGVVVLGRVKISHVVKSSLFSRTDLINKHNSNDLPNTHDSRCRDSCARAGQNKSYDKNAYCQQADKKTF